MLTLGQKEKAAGPLAKGIPTALLNAGSKAALFMVPCCGRNVKAGEGTPDEDQGADEGSQIAPDSCGSAGDRGE